MPFIKGPDDFPEIKICRSPEHNPPNMVVLKPGMHVWRCPSCGRQITFRVPERILGETIYQSDLVLSGMSMVSNKPKDEHGRKMRAFGDPELTIGKSDWIS